jgi:asparagine synthase (glutamine-hydrolysing)
MCGIYAILNNRYSKYEAIYKQFIRGKTRGPEYSQLLNVEQYNTYLGFHRLAINGVNDKKSQQPFYIDGIYLICNGEIYNFKQLYQILDIVPYSKSDCEVIIHLYKRYGIKQTLQMLDGVYAFILMDTNTDKIYISRDTFGIRPLFESKLSFYVSPNNNYISMGFASEMKSLISPENKKLDITIKQFQPGSFSVYNFKTLPEIEYSYISFESSHLYSRPLSFSNIFNYNNIYQNIYDKLYDAVNKRVDNTEREIACLLSGGLDSSLIAAIVKKIHKGPLHTWSIGFKGSEDLKYAQLVADHIKSIHHSIEVDEKDFLDAIPQVIYNIESYDTTTVRASVGNWLICKKIKEQSNAKVIFNGDGADEVMGGYLYFHLANDSIEFDKECRKLLENIHYFDVLRSDRSISSHGLEARTPFLDRNFVQYYLSITHTLRHHANDSNCEKYLIRNAINEIDNNLLPHAVLFRTKEAFSDGVSKQTKSWYEIIQDYVKKLYNVDVENNSEENILLKYNKYIFNTPKTLEQLFYRNIFSEKFPHYSCDKTIPYFWMPNFIEATDASARTLDIYKTKIKSNEKTLPALS